MNKNKHLFCVFFCSWRVFLHFLRPLNDQQHSQIDHRAISLVSKTYEVCEKMSTEKQNTKKRKQFLFFFLLGQCEICCYLCSISPSGVDAERVYSLQSRIISRERCSLGRETTQRLVFVRWNQKMLDS